MKNKTSKQGFASHPENINLAGDASEYDPKYIKKVDVYIALRQDKEVDVVRQVGGKKGSGKSYKIFDQKLQVKLPTIEGFADYLGVTRKTLYNWAEDYGDFAHALEKIKTEQLERLIDEGLAGTYNSTIAKLVLSSNHGMREKSDVTTDDKPINNFSDEQVDRIADRIASRKDSDGGAPGA